MIPDAALIPVFAVLTLLPVIAVAVGAGRAWRAWYEGSLWATRPRALGRSMQRAAVEILAHRKFSTCKERRLRPWAHRAVLFSVLGLAAVSGVVALLLLAGRSYPLSLGNPLKVLSNVFAALLIGGAGYFLLARVIDASHGNRSAFFDWAFIVNVLLAGVSGVATEVLRVADVQRLGLPGLFPSPGNRPGSGVDPSLHQACSRRLPPTGRRRPGVRGDPPGRAFVPRDCLPPGEQRRRSSQGRKPATGRRGTGHAGGPARAEPRGARRVRR